MNWWNLQVKVGLVVIIGFILLLVLLYNASNSPWAASGDLLQVNFSFVNDLRVGAAVHLAGVQIGKVTSIELSEDGNRVEVQMRAKGAFRRLRVGCRVKIGIIGFVGEAYIDLANGPPGNPPLRPVDLPLTGEDPIGVLGVLEQAEQTVMQVTQLIESANQLIQANQSHVSDGITEMGGLVTQTKHALESIVKRTDETITNLNRIAQANDFRLQQTFRQFHRLINQLESDSLVISSQASDLTRTVIDLVDRNSAPVEQIIADLQASSASFRQTSQQLDQNLTELKSELSDLILQSQNVIETEKSKVDRLLDNLTTITGDLDGLGDNLTKFLDKVQHGEGSIAELLNKPNAINEAQEALRTAEKTMLAIQDLSRTLDQKSKRFQFPELAWDYELRYLSLEEHLHNELAVLLLPTPNQRYRFGLGVRQEDVKFEFQYGYDFANYLRARIGFMRSRVGLGLDIWMLSRKLGLTIEGTRLTSKNPELSTEMSWRIFPYGYIIVGAENLTEDIRYTAGFRLAARNW